jgi:hypothetical protein
MKIDNSNKRNFIIIAGILVILVVSFSMAIIVLGVGRFRIKDSNITHPLFLGSISGSSNDKYESKKSGNHKSVPIAKSCDELNVDTLPGTITYVGGFYDDPLPLCIDANVVSDWWIAYEVTGGYDPWDILPGNCKLYGTITLDQDKTGARGTILMKDYVSKCCGCGCKIYNFTGLELADGPIILDSNHLPQVNDCSLMCCPDPNRELGKRVDINIMTNWEGCPNLDQKFGLILAHKNLFPESPTPEINISPPVECNIYIICF